MLEDQIIEQVIKRWMHSGFWRRMGMSSQDQPILKAWAFSPEPRDGTCPIRCWCLDRLQYLKCLTTPIIVYSATSYHKPSESIRFLKSKTLIIHIPESLIDHNKHIDQPRLEVRFSLSTFVASTSESRPFQHPHLEWIGEASKYVNMLSIHFFSHLKSMNIRTKKQFRTFHTSNNALAGSHSFQSLARKTSPEQRCQVQSFWATYTPEAIMKSLLFRNRGDFQDPVRTLVLVWKHSSSCFCSGALNAWIDIPQSFNTVERISFPITFCASRLINISRRYSCVVVIIAVKYRRRCLQGRRRSQRWSENNLRTGLRQCMIQMTQTSFRIGRTIKAGVGWLGS